MTIKSLKNKITNGIRYTTIRNEGYELIKKFNEEALELQLALMANDNRNSREEIADVLIVLVQIMEEVDFCETDLEMKLLDVIARYGVNNYDQC